MERQNITLSVPKDILQKVKHIAIDKNTSVSALLVSTLEQMVKQEDAYNDAKSRQLMIMEKGYQLGCKEEIPWKREDLHER